MNELLPSTLRMNSVVPVAMEAMRCEVDRGHLGVRDVLAFRIGSAIELTPHAQPGRGAGGTDEIDDHRETHERLAAPVGADVREEPVIATRVRLANRCSSHFHSRTRAPLLPPASAVMSNERARR